MNSTSFVASLSLFTDFHGELATAVREGRRKEFASFTRFSGEDIPDPNAVETFEHSKVPADGDDSFHRRLLQVRRDGVGRLLRVCLPDCGRRPAGCQLQPGSFGNRREGEQHLGVRMPDALRDRAPPFGQFLDHVDDRGEPVIIVAVHGVLQFPDRPLRRAGHRMMLAAWC